MHKERYHCQAILYILLLQADLLYEHIYSTSFRYVLSQ